MEKDVKNENTIHHLHYQSSPFLLPSDPVLTQIHFAFVNFPLLDTLLMEASYYITRQLLFLLLLEVARQ